MKSILLRFVYIFKKEIISTRSNLPFHIIVVLMPLMFFTFWVINLSEDISLPVVLTDNSGNSEFGRYLKEYKTPMGINYFDVIEQKETGNYMNSIIIKKDIEEQDHIITGHIVQNFNSIDRNMTKNFRNRLTGAITSFLEKYFLKTKALIINEHTSYKQDVPWNNFFVASLLNLGMIICGLLFASLSYAHEQTAGTKKFLNLSPVSPLWLVTGKLLACLGKGILASGFFIGVALVFVPIRQISITGLLLTFLLAYFVSVCAGMLIGILVKDTIICFLVSLVSSLFLWLLGNGFGVFAVIGVAGGVITAVNPFTYSMELAQHYINQGPVRVAACLLILSYWGSLLFILCLFVYYKKIYRPAGG
jgi:ABC-2 type transport system permease protein